MRRKFILTIIVALFVQSASCVAFQPSLVDKRVSEVGVNNAAAELYDDAKGWQTLLRRVGAGERTWIEAAAKIYPSAGAAINQDLLESFQRSLDVSPHLTLRILKPHVAALCNGEDIDAASENAQDQRRRVERRIAVIGRIQSQSLVKVRNECIRLLHASH